MLVCGDVAVALQKKCVVVLLLSQGACVASSLCRLYRDVVVVLCCRVAVLRCDVLSRPRVEAVTRCWKKKRLEIVLSALLAFCSRLSGIIASSSDLVASRLGIDWRFAQWQTQKWKSSFVSKRK